MSGAEEVHLRFWQWFPIILTHVNDSHDYGRVQISTDDGQSWVDVGNHIQDYSCGWSLCSIDLTAYAGQRVRIAFIMWKTQHYGAQVGTSMKSVLALVPAFGDGL